MKRIIPLLLSVLFIVSSCEHANSPTTTEPTTTEPTEAEPTEAEAAIAVGYALRVLIEGQDYGESSYNDFVEIKDNNYVFNSFPVDNMGDYTSVSGSVTIDNGLNMEVYNLEFSGKGTVPTIYIERDLTTWKYIVVRANGYNMTSYFNNVPTTDM